MKTYVFNFALIACLITAASCNQSDDSKNIAEDRNEQRMDGNKSENVAEFVVDAADGGMLKVQLGQLALTKATTAEVKELANHILTDHTKANLELQALAQQKNITLPTALSKKSQDKYDDLANKTGLDFDKEYADLMVKEHKDAVDSFQKESDKGNDAEVKSWATGKLSSLQHHLTMAENTQKMVKEEKKEDRKDNK